MHTRLPMLSAAYPQSESLAFQQQDPFSDPDIGPDTGFRPPGFDRPRTAARRAAEQRVLQGLSASPEDIPPGYPRGGLSSPRTVR